jgi:peroxiredoxin Q/BCP
MDIIAVGNPVPDFSLPGTCENIFHLSACRGHFVVLYFYPKDNTPGCILQGQAFRDYYGRFQALNAIVFGISRDSTASHEKFKARQQFPFELLADQNEDVCNLFDVLKMKNMYGKQVRGIERSAFLIAPDGLLVKAWRKVKGIGHVEDILQVLQTESTATE